MRPIDKVMDAILKLVPADFKNLDTLKSDFDKIKKAYKVTAPEAVRQIEQLWFALGTSLNEELGEPDAPWKEDVIALVQGQKDYKDILDA